MPTWMRGKIILFDSPKRTKKRPPFIMIFSCGHRDPIDVKC